MDPIKDMEIINDKLVENIEKSNNLKSSLNKIKNFSNVFY